MQRLNTARASGSKPSFDSWTLRPPLSAMRMTIFSPGAQGSTETRRSISLSPTRTLRRPSWGRRRSEMSRLDMIFRRAQMAAWYFLGGAGCSWSTPSMR